METNGVSVGTPWQTQHKKFSAILGDSVWFKETDLFPHNMLSSKFEPSVNLTLKLSFFFLADFIKCLNLSISVLCPFDLLRVEETEGLASGIWSFRTDFQIAQPIGWAISTNGLSVCVSVITFEPCDWSVWLGLRGCNWESPKLFGHSPKPCSSLTQSECSFPDSLANKRLQNWSQTDTQKVH